MLVTELLDPRPGDAVLDLCAAPGGKATHIASRGASVDAVEIHEHRAGLIAASAKRLGVSDRVGVAVADGRSWEGRAGGYSGVLVDAPCTSLGTIRRRPEVKWRLSEDDLSRLSTLQSELLEAGARQVGSGGCLVYAVCSTEPEEGEGVVEAFLSSHGQWREEARMRTWPDEEDMDGFFAVRLERP